MTNDRIFLSHSSSDKPFVRQLAARLGLIGLAPWLDEVEIKPGASLIGEIEHGLSTSRYLFAVMSEQAPEQPMAPGRLDVCPHARSGEATLVLPRIFPQMLDRGPRVSRSCCEVCNEL